MHRNIFLLGLILAVVTIATFVLDYQGQSEPAPESVPLQARGNIAPDAPLQRLDGRRAHLRDFAGRPIILHFWATWCPPCVVEFPQLMQLAQRRPEIIIVAVSVDADSTKLARFLQKAQGQATLKSLPANFIVALDPDKVLAQDVFQTVRLPETILIDTELRMVDKIAGPVKDWLSPAMMIQLDALK